LLTDFDVYDIFAVSFKNAIKSVYYLVTFSASFLL